MHSKIKVCIVLVLAVFCGSELQAMKCQSQESLKEILAVERRFTDEDKLFENAPVFFKNTVSATSEDGSKLAIKSCLYSVLCAMNERFTRDGNVGALRELIPLQEKIEKMKDFVDKAEYQAYSYLYRTTRYLINWVSLEREYRVCRFNGSVEDCELAFFILNQSKSDSQFSFDINALFFN